MYQNIGIRQKDREGGNNIINVTNLNEKSIHQAIKKALVLDKNSIKPSIMLTRFITEENNCESNSLEKWQK